MSFSRHPARLSLPVLASLALALVLGCGEAEQATRPASPLASAAEPPPDSASEPAEEAAEAGEEEERRPVLTRTVTPDGEIFEAEFGKAGELPSGFPDDVPVYENARPLSSMASPQHGTVVNLRSADAPENVFGWYRDRYEAQGWEIEVAQQGRAQSTIVARKGNRVSSLRITGVPGATQALLRVAEER